MSTPQGVRPTFIYDMAVFMIWFISLSLGLGLFSFDKHIII